MALLLPGGAPTARADGLDDLLGAVLDGGVAQPAADLDPSGGDGGLTSLGNTPDDLGNDFSGLGDTFGLAGTLFFDLPWFIAYGMIEHATQDWITGPFGEQVDNLINQPFMDLTGRDLIGNGIDGTVSDPDGGDGGWLFGDGGNGYDATADGETGVAGAQGSSGPSSVTVTVPAAS